LAIDVRLPTGEHRPSYLLLPPDYRPGQRLPLVITTYVCDGFLRGGTGDEFPIYPLAAQGFAVLCHSHLQGSTMAVEARRTLDQAEQEQSAGEGEPFERRIQAGIDQVVAELDRRGIINADRIGITGLSMGSTTVLWALYHMPRLAAAISTTAQSPEATF